MEEPINEFSYQNLCPNMRMSKFLMENGGHFLYREMVS